MARKKVERNISYDEERKRFYINLDFGIDPNTGKQVKRTKTAQKLTEARSILRQHEADRDRGAVVMPKKLTLSEWLETWMKTVVIPNRAATTAITYQGIINKHINPALGKIPLQKLSSQQLQAYYADKKAKDKLSNNTIRKHHDLLHSALRIAVRQKILPYNPADYAEAPRVRKPEISFYTKEDEKRLFALAKGTRLETLIMLCGIYGLRREEALGLTWKDINFKTKEIRVRRARTTTHGITIEKDTKNTSSDRTLKMLDEIEQLLRQTQKQQHEYKEQLGDQYKDSGYVITHEDGRPIRPNYASELFTKFIQDNKLPPLTLHGLRHTFATIANAKGISMFDISKALGHSTPATTSKIYTHLLDTTHEDMLTKMWDTKE